MRMTRGLAGGALAVALLAGLFAMHGLSAGEHRLHAPAASAGTGAMTHSPDPSGPAHSPAAMAASLPAGVVDLLVAAAGDGGALVAACLAVLVAGLLLGLPASRYRLRMSTDHSATRWRERLQVRPPPRDLLSVLCVLRT